MRVVRTLFGVLFFAMLFAGGYALAATTTVALTAKGPEPATVSVEWGDTVVFSNGDTVERGVTSQRASIESPGIPPGGTFEHRYDGRAGRYSFFQTGTRPFTSGVVVVSATGKVTLEVSKRVALYRSTVALSGRSGYPDTPVVVQLRPFGSSGDWLPVLTRTAGADGTYSGRIRLTTGGRLRALVAAEQVSSDLADVAVKPKLVASARPRRARAGARIVVTGRIVPALAAREADLERYNAERKRWVRESSKKVSKAGKVTFALKAEKGRNLLRVSLRRTGLGPGFEATTSKSVLVRGS